MPVLFSSTQEEATNEQTPTEVSENSSDVSFSESDRVKGMKQSTIKYPQSEEERRLLPGHTDNPMASFNYFPEKVDFINKDEEEKVILILRKHPITNLKWMIISFFMLILPPFVSVLPVFDALPGKYFLLILLSWYMISIAYVFENFLSWYFSVSIVTDERVFDVDFYNLIYRKITDAEIEEIQEVTVQIGGGLRTMFNYGDVTIQTASEMPEIVYEAVPMPDRVAKVLRELQVEEEVEKIEGRVR